MAASTTCFLHLGSCQSAAFCNTPHVLDPNHHVYVFFENLIFERFFQTLPHTLNRTTFSSVFVKSVSTLCTATPTKNLALSRMLQALWANILQINYTFLPTQNRCPFFSPSILRGFTCEVSKPYYRFTSEDTRGLTKSYSITVYLRSWIVNHQFDQFCILSLQIKSFTYTGYIKMDFFSSFI